MNVHNKQLLDIVLLSFPNVPVNVDNTLKETIERYVDVK